MKKTSFLNLIFLLLFISMLGATPALGKTPTSSPTHHNTLTGDAPYGATMDPIYDFTDTAVSDWHALGMTWVRKQFNWKDIETCPSGPGPSTYDFSKVDAF